MRLIHAVAFSLAFACAQVHAQAPVLDASMNEAVVQVPKGSGPFSVELETTIYKPDGNGPFPVAVINHGKAWNESRFQPRYRPARAARYFLERGYAVVVPMRQGFSKSTGFYVGGGCNVESNGRAQAEDVTAVLGWLRSQPWADAGRVVVVGQSHGGWTTLAFGASGAAPGVKGLINFAGGLRQDDCPGWRDQLVTAAAKYGKETKLPSLWFYGDNDSFFDPPTWRAMHSQYKAAGGDATLVPFGIFGSDSHGLFNSLKGTAIWAPEVSAFLQRVGMPYQPLPAYAKYAPKPPMEAPPATSFAPLNDETRVPHIKDNGRAAYRKWLEAERPRAFAISPKGAWGWAYGGDDPLQRALDLCNGGKRTDCKLYSVDDQVVWPEGQP